MFLEVMTSFNHDLKFGCSFFLNFVAFKNSWMTFDTQ